MELVQKVLPLRRKIVAEIGQGSSGSRCHQHVQVVLPAGTGIAHLLGVDEVLHEAHAWEEGKRHGSDPETAEACVFRGPIQISVLQEITTPVSGSVHLLGARAYELATESVTEPRKIGTAPESSVFPPSQPRGR